MRAGAREITRASKSNLALAFVSLRGQRHRDITTLYAFCRLIDDIADDPLRSPEAKRVALAGWRRSLHEKFADEPPLAQAVRQLTARYPITPEVLEEIIAGVEMDTAINRYATFEELQQYCYRVASAVGLASIEIFGYKNRLCQQYAVQLGLALQVTNIIRDVATDLAVNRIYIPAEDLARFCYSEVDLEERTYDARFLQLMEFQAQRAEAFFAEAARLLPIEDRRSMLPAEIMRSVYLTLLSRMKRDRFRVFQKRYRLSPAEKVLRVGLAMVRLFESRPRDIRRNG
jgi:phytoene synthase